MVRPHAYVLRSSYYYKLLKTTMHNVSDTTIWGTSSHTLALGILTTWVLYTNDDESSSPLRTRSPVPTRVVLVSNSLLEITILLLTTLTIILCESVAIPIRRSSPAFETLELSLHPRDSFSLFSLVHALSRSSGLSSWFLSSGYICGFPGLLDRSYHQDVEFLDDVWGETIDIEFNLSILDSASDSF